MQIKEAADRLGLTQRRLRHYEQEGLLDIARSDTGYRVFTEADLRRAGRIRDLIASGFSTRELRKMSDCLSDAGDAPCEGGIPLMRDKLASIVKSHAIPGTEHRTGGPQMAITSVVRMLVADFPSLVATSELERDILKSRHFDCNHSAHDHSACDHSACCGG